MCIEIRNDKKWLIFFYKGRRGEPGIAQVANVKKKHVGKVLFLLLMSLFGLSFFFFKYNARYSKQEFFKSRNTISDYWNLLYRLFTASRRFAINEQKIWVDWMERMTSNDCYFSPYHEKIILQRAFSLCCSNHWTHRTVQTTGQLSFCGCIVLLIYLFQEID